MAATSPDQVWFAANSIPCPGSRSHNITPYNTMCVRRARLTQLSQADDLWCVQLRQ